MVPVEQQCPICNETFLGSDMVGFPCDPCGGMPMLTGDQLTELLKELDKGTTGHD